MIASNPTSAALMMLSKSGRLANRHNPRYSPVRQNTMPCASSTSATSADHSGASSVPRSSAQRSSSNPDQHSQVIARSCRTMVSVGSSEKRLKNPCFMLLFLFLQPFTPE